MATFLGFLVNCVTQDEFVAPVEASTRGTASAILAEKYPTPAYTLLTVYERAELVKILASLDRWPGLPSKVQPPLHEVLAKVKVRAGGLPPMPQARSLPVADDARIEEAKPSLPAAAVAQVRTMVQGQPQEVQALAARLLAAQVGEVAVTKVAQPVSQAPKAAAVSAAPAPANAAPQSLIAALQASRVHAAAAAPMAPASARGLAAPSSTAAPRPLSVIEMLKAMRQ